MNPTELEEIYQGYIKDLPSHLPDGILEVDLSLLQELGLLTEEPEPFEDDESDLLTCSFYVVESTEKLTLFNQKFVVWIVPQLINDLPTTYTLVAVNKGEQASLEMVFATSGIYNHSSLVLRILEKFLEQIEENEEEITKYDAT